MARSPALPNGNPNRSQRVGLPPRPFMYTLDQIATLIDVSERALRVRFIHFAGRSVGRCPPGKMMCRDIRPPNDDNPNPDWRVSESEFVRWLRHKGWMVYERGWAKPR